MKINRILRKKYTEKKFKKKVLSRLFLEDEKKAILDFYKLENGFYIPSDTTDSKKIKELNRIAKTAKKNSGALGIGKTGAMAAVIILTVLFSVFLKNPLAEKGMEKALEAAFKAEAEIDSLSLSILKGDISFKAMRVADSDNPDRNLFETGKAQIDINMAEALKGKFDAENIELEYLSLNTVREKRGKKIESPEKSKEGGISLPSLKAPEINSDSVKKAIKDNIKNLSTPARLNSIKASYDNSKAEIKKEIADTEKEIKALEKKIDSILSVKIKSALEIKKLKKLASDIKSASKSADNIRNDIKNTGKKISSASKISSESSTLLKKAAEEDIKILAEKLNPAQSLDVSSLLKSYIMNSFAPFLTKYEKAFAVAAKMKPDGYEKKKKQVKVQRGQKISFPVTGNTPKFLIEKISGSFLDGEKQFSMKIDSITNNQDLLGRASGFSLNYNKENEIIALKGFFDSREKREKNSHVELELPSVNFSMKNIIPGIKKAEGIYNLTADASIGRDKSLSGSALIRTTDYKTEGTDDLTGKAISAVLNKNTALEFKISFTAGKDKQNIKVDSNMDSLLKNTFSPSEITKEQKEIIRSGIESYFKDSILNNEQISSEIGSLNNELDSLKNSIDKEKKSLEKKLKIVPSKLL